MINRSLSRESALQFLFRYTFPQAQEMLKEGELEDIYREFEDSSPLTLSAKDRSYCLSLIEGTLENYSTLQERIGEVSDHWKLERMPKVDRTILLLFGHELLHHDKIPKKVILNEAIELAKKYSTEKSGKFVNGILDKLK